MAHIFTGWTRGDDEQRYSGQSYYYYFRTSFHDYDAKLLFGAGIPAGRTGAQGELDGYEAIELCLARESRFDAPYKAAAMFLGGKLLRHFVGQAVPLDAQKEFAFLLQVTQYNIHEAMRTLLKSRLFFSPEFYRTEYRSPIEYVVSFNRLAEIFVNADFRAMHNNANKMGQEFMNPPNVAGWDEGAAWINVNNLLERINYGYYMESYYNAGKLDPDLLIYSTEISNTQMVDELIERFIGDTIRPKARQALLDYTTEEDSRTFGRGPDAMRQRKVVKLVHLIAALPEMQMK